MHLGANGPLRAGGGGFNLFDDVGGAAGHVGFLNDFPFALGVDDYLHVRVFGADLIDVLGTEKGVDGAVAFPEDKGGVLDLLFGVAAQIFLGVPGDHFVQGITHGVGGVSAKVLVGE